MREICSYGSVGEPVGNHRLYPEGSGNGSVYPRPFWRKRLRMALQMSHSTARMPDSALVSSSNHRLSHRHGKLFGIYG
jgi:hypothetical protein